MTRLLVIDDDHALARRVAATLRWHGHEVLDADAPNTARALVREPLHQPNLVMLSVALSRASDPPLLLQLRQDGYTGPIIVWCASRKESDIALSFRLGADQYVVTPFGMHELIARVDASLTRSAQQRASDATATSTATYGSRTRHVFGDIEVDSSSRTVRRRGSVVHLSPLEFDLLVALLRREGAVTSRTELLQEVWNYGPGVVSRTLDTHILNLRLKLKNEPGEPRHILTVRKVGYRLDV